MNEYNSFLNAMQNPSDQYGEVPFYWWTGEKIDKKRLKEQLEELHKNGVCGVQINYAHAYKNGETDKTFGGAGRSIPGEPYQFSDEWWDVFSFAAHECERLGMGIGVGDYTIAWIGNGFFTDTLAQTPGMEAYNLSCEKKMLFSPDETPTDEGVLAVITYPNGDYNTPQILYEKGKEENQVSFGCTECYILRVNQTPLSINPMANGVGETLTELYFKEFERRVPGLKRGTLNYFFQDELLFGCDERTLWHEDLRTEFMTLNGYDVLGFLPHMFWVLNEFTPKLRLDLQKAKTKLIEERYFKPVYDFHAQRDMIYGCDQSSRGRRPDEFSDYFSTVKWFTAPGNDTPGRAADLIKVKVNSSISHLYHRPRTWLEAYHSSGWGTTLESITAATDDNFIFGANLLNLHGLYYSTLGGFFEWAPPDFHFRMPYWQDEAYWLQKYKRMSAMLTTGVHRCDCAVFYPVSSCDYHEHSEDCVEHTFHCAKMLFENGVDFDFMDYQSICNAQIKDGKLCISGEEYSAVILCSVDTVRFCMVEKLKEFVKNGGCVLFEGILPYASDRAGANDSVLNMAIREILSCKTARVASTDNELLNAVNTLVTRSFLPDVAEQTGKVYVMCRKTDEQTLYYVRYAKKNSVCRFLAQGKPYLLDVYQNKIHALTGTVQKAGFTFIKMPLEANENTVILFTNENIYPDSEINTCGFAQRPMSSKQVISTEWAFRLKPTLNNRYGDFFMPPTDIIGAQARFFDCKSVTDINTLPDTYDDTEVPYGCACAITKIDTEVTNQSVKSYSLLPAELPRCKPYRLNERWGVIEHDGNRDMTDSVYEQGYHGLKGKIHPDNLVFENDCIFVMQVYAQNVIAYPLLYGIKPDYLYINGNEIKNSDAPVTLLRGTNRIALGFIYNKENKTEIRNMGNIKHAGYYLTKTQAPKQMHIPLSKNDFMNDDYLPLVPIGALGDVYCLCFETVPGFCGFEAELAGELLAVYHQGEKLAFTKKGKGIFGKPLYTAKTDEVSIHTSRVHLFIKAEPGFSYASIVVKPIDLVTKTGRISLGDTMQIGALKNYSGQMVYTNYFDMEELSIDDIVMLDLGKVGATARVKINDNLAAVLTYAPFNCDITALVKPGENTLEVTVSNTLCNHYSTIPSRYANFPVDGASGLMGPVVISVEQPPIEEDE